MSRSVYAIATMDTKGTELGYVADCLRKAGVAVTTVDVGTLDPPTETPDVSREKVLAGQSLPDDGDRGTAVTTMGDALRDFLLHECEQDRVAGVIGIGGSGGTALITAAMRALPIGLPKLMVSTVASGNTSPYVDCSDITMMFSVVDVAGLNVVSEKILGNAAHAMAGMVSHNTPEREKQPTLGMTMFGVTTPCVTAVREQLEAEGFDCLVFHATGTGGRAMEKLVANGMIDGVLDITTTEVADEIVGGIFPAGPKRFEISIQRGIPLVMSVGAVDMVNFGGLETVPEKFQNRNLHVHNAQVTLMRTTVEENRQIADWIAEKVNQSTAPVSILIPEKGVSMLDAPEQPFYDPDADAALFSELETRLDRTETRKIIRLPHHINDPEVSQALVAEFHQLLNLS
ncbi:MAG: Tm-1-like ATP-binding domain-containing protein [Planctomycetaceae bacterium]|nr:Tm-1-like ATP-binding domain-containing protein [Planctomycetaceae bacterium]